MGANLVEAESHTIHYGTVLDADQGIIDEVLVSVFVAPKSYTGENSVEISCHGSQYILQRVIERCLSMGARMSQPGEFTMRAFMNGKLDLSQAEAVSDLVASESKAAHHAAMQQMRGGYSKKMEDLRQRLIHFASMLELELDFGEEDVEFADRTKLRTLVQETLANISSLIQSFKLGNAIKKGVTTVIAGRPNAGKSTLLNGLLNEDRAIVSEIAGTTRDTIEEIINIDGIDFRLIDTAGIRDARDQIEEMGVQKTLDKISKATLLLYVFDVVSTTATEVRNDLEKLDAKNLTVLVIANKIDVNPYAKAEQFLPSEYSYEQFIPVSAKHNTNLEHLKKTLFDQISRNRSSESIIVTNSRHVDALHRASTSLKDVLQGFEDQISSDLIALSIRSAINYLGEITGKISTDDLLENIFRNFCIGK